MVEKLTNIELDSIKLTETRPRDLRIQHNTDLCQENDIETAVGQIHVVVVGDQSKPAILTYHDLGLNHSTCFHGFFNYDDMQPILKHFCVYHLNAPGQQEGALPLVSGPHILNQDKHERNAELLGSSPDDDQECEGPISSEYHYPTMDQLADMILPVLQFYQIRRFIGFGAGVGCNILCRFALLHPTAVDSLFLVNPCAGKAGWIEWGYQKMNAWYLKSGQMTNFTENYLLWHWFGEQTQDRNHDLVHVYKEAAKGLNPHNLGLFIESYVKRSDLGLVREIDPVKQKTVRNFKCNVMLVTGDDSPHLDSTVAMNSRLDPARSSWSTLADCGGMPLEEQPEKVCDEFRLFLQGMGYVPSLSQTRIMEERASQHSLYNKK